MSDNTIDRRAHELRHNSKVSARYDELMAELAKRVLWDQERAAASLFKLLTVSEDKVDLATREQTETVMTTDKSGRFVQAMAKTIPVDVPKNASKIVLATVKELNKMFDVYDRPDAGDGRVVIVDDL